MRRTRLRRAADCWDRAAAVVKTLQQMTEKIAEAVGHLFENEVATRWLSISPMGQGGTFAFIGENPTKNAVINYYLHPIVAGEESVTIKITDVIGNNARSYTIEKPKPGISKLIWDMRFDAPPPPPSEDGESSDSPRRGLRRSGRSTSRALIGPLWRCWATSTPRDPRMQHRLHRPPSRRRLRSHSGTRGMVQQYRST